MLEVSIVLALFGGAIGGPALNWFLDKTADSDESE